MKKYTTLNMKRTLFCFIFSFSLLVCHGQTWLWGQQGKGDIKANDEGAPVATDKYGNAIITGDYNSSITFGTINMSNYNDGIYVVKYNSSGNLQWALQPKPTLSGGYSYSYSVATSRSAQIYICGFFNDSLTFAPYTLTKGSCFLAKFDGNGNTLWEQAGITDSTGNAAAGGVATYGSAYAFITGYYSQKVLFGTDTLKEPIPGNSTFLTKYDSNGNVVWAETSSANTLTAFSYGYGNAVDNAGNSYITGEFYDSLYFGSNALFTNSPNANVFVAKYDPSGNALWAVSANLNSAKCGAGGCAVATDKANNVYVIGMFSDTISFGSQTLIAGASSYDEVFVVKYSPTGGVIWAKASQDTGIFTSPRISTDDYGHEYLAYSTGGSSVKFGGHTLSGTKKAANYIIKLDSSGHVMCNSYLTMPVYTASGVASDSTGGYVYTAGTFSGDTLRVGADTLKSTGSGVPYVARWQSCELSDEGVNELTTNSGEVRVYPNPSNGVFTVAIKNYELKITSVVEVYDMLGEKVLTASLNPSEGGTSNTVITLPFGEGQGGAGIYLYRVISETGQLIGTGKLIKE
jgi:hypothetical protein